MPDNPRDDLESLGFTLIGRWLLDRMGSLDIEKGQEAVEAIWEGKPALYAFAGDADVLYIGKTTRSIRQRLAGYKNPGNSQQTNKKCNSNIIGLLKADKTVHILGFCPDSKLAFGGFAIDLAAGLEDALIACFAPSWNGKTQRSGVPITETQQLEEDALGSVPPPPIAPPQQPTQFVIALGDTYYNKGFINPGVNVDKYIGGHGEDILIYLGTTDTPVMSVINRNAVTNRCARIHSRVAIAQWFQSHFRIGDNVEAHILNPHAILLKLPHA